MGRKKEDRVKQTCQGCDWYWTDSNPVQSFRKSDACYKGGKGPKWLKKGGEDKPNACPDFKKDS